MSLKRNANTEAIPSSNNKNPKVILITGCSSGFGLLMAVRLASRGHTVIATMRNLAKQNELLSELNRCNASAKVLQLDVTYRQSIKSFVEQIAAEYGYVDVLVNNAGYGIGGFFEDLTEQEIRDQMETNFFAVMNLTREIIPLMRQRKRGKIINLSSVSGFNAYPCFSAYNCSKWALEAFSESLYYELKVFGIDVHLIEPGSYKTKIFFDNKKMAKNANNPESPYYEMTQYLQNKVDQFLADNHKDPQEIAALVEDIINNKKRAFRNIPDFESRIIFILRKILPFRIFSTMISRSLNLKKYIK